MLTHIQLPHTCPRRVSFFLAMEEYLARYTDWECFFTWIVPPSVIVGRNQLIANEVNMEFCRQNGITLFRRKSGGGCVYADEGNVMLSYVGSGGDVQAAFSRYVNRVAHALSAVGIPSVAVSGRNDILVDGRKVSGNAFYHLHDRNIVHGTLLYDTRMDFMTGCLTPDNQKLEVKGIHSVNQRITLLKRHYPHSLPALVSQLEEAMTDGHRQLTETDINAIFEIEQEYCSPDFLYGHEPAYTRQRHFYKKGCGSIAVSLTIRHNVIQKIKASGDYLELADAEALVFSPLVGVPYTRDDITRQCNRIDVSRIIMNLTNRELIDLILTT